MSNQSNYMLFVDEIGSPELDDPRPYILSGCSIEDFRRQELQNYADHIKYKYWGRTDIVFHSKEIGRSENAFKILLDPEVRNNFEKDLLAFLEESSYKLFFVVLDKEQAQKENWTTEIGIYSTAGAMFRNFLLSLKVSNATGTILIEPSYFEKDSVFLKAFNYFRSPQSNLNQDFGIDYKEMQELLTALSFVTKQNFDTEVQIADLMAYAAWQTVKKYKPKGGSYEHKISKILEKKLFKLHYRNNITKTKMYKGIKPLMVLPKDSHRKKHSKNETQKKQPPKKNRNRSK